MGMFGVDAFDAILPGQSCILAVGGSKPTVVPVDGMIGVKTMMTVNLTADHRHINGDVAATFLKTLKAVIEDPKDLVLILESLRYARRSDVERRLGVTARETRGRRATRRAVWDAGGTGVVRRGGASDGETRGSFGFLTRFLSRRVIYVVFVSSRVDA